MVTFEDVLEAGRTIEKWVYRTPAIRAYGLEKYFGGAEIYLKLENMQLVGAFKLRGATNAILHLTEEQRARGVVSASSGNHAQGVAFAATRLGIPSTIVMPLDAVALKKERTKAFGADVVLCGYSGEEREQKGHEIAEETGRAWIHSHGTHHIIAGQGTVALELLDQVPDLDEIVCPTGAGGLISGTVIAAHGVGKGKVKVTAVEPAAIPRYATSLKEGKAVTVPAGKTLADGLRVNTAAPLNFEVLSKYPPSFVAQEDEGLTDMMVKLLGEQKVLAEPSAVIGLAAAAQGKIDTGRGRKLGFIISGGNVDLEFVKSIL